MLTLSRRTSLAGTAALAASIVTSRYAFAQAPAAPFKLDPLPYPNNALEPHIDGRPWKSITTGTTRPTSTT